MSIFNNYFEKRFADWGVPDEYKESFRTIASDFYELGREVGEMETLCLYKQHFRDKFEIADEELRRWQQE